MEAYVKEFDKWMNSPAVSDGVKKELASLTEDEKKERFSGYMTFGTAGLRAKMGAGCAFMNEYTVAHATAGLARLVLDEGAADRGVVIACDSRLNSDAFSRRCAEVLSAYGVKAYIFPSLRPTPVLSYAIMKLGCIAGINITASHNPSVYNGYKAYWEDGAQLPPDHAKRVSDAMGEIGIFDVPSSADANPALIFEVSDEVDVPYLDCVLAERVNPDAIPSVADGFNIVYTPLHGAGAVMVPQVLRRAGVKHLYTVEEQMAPDGTFPTVYYPNPEFPEAFKLGIALAEKVGSDLVVATDPDCDRVGVMARCSDGTFRAITGNQMGALLIDYIIRAYEEKGCLPADAYAVKSVVSANLAQAIAEAHGVKFYNVLTGFKFIGEVIKQHIAEGHGTFLLGFEESYGYLKGTYARDKDAVVASLLICEMAAFYKARNMTLADALEALFGQYGRYGERVKNIQITGLDAAGQMAQMMKALRDNPPTSLGGMKIAEVRDYLSGEIVTADGETKPTGLPTTNMLYYVTESGDTFIVRPSGTEPKIKVYILAKADTEKELELHLAALEDEAKKMFA